MNFERGRGKRDWKEEMGREMRGEWWHLDGPEELPPNKQATEHSVIEAQGPCAAPAKRALSSLCFCSAGGGRSASVWHLPGLRRLRLPCVRKLKVREPSQALSQPQWMGSCHRPAITCLCVCLFHQVDFQGHDHALIIILSIPSGTGQAHSRSAIDVEWMNSLRKLLSQRNVGGF